VTASVTSEPEWALARISGVTRSIAGEHLRDEVIAFGDAHTRLLAIEAELRRLGFAISAHSVRRDARTVAGAVGWRALWLGYGLVTVARAIDRATHERAPGPE
jgi:hypothetical protein